MDVICCKTDGQTFQIVLACSDAVLRKFRFDLASGKLQLAAESDPPETHAFLRIRKSGSGNEFLTSGTSGKIILWSLDSLAKIKEFSSVHISGINSMLSLPNVGVVTGGDDGGLGLHGPEIRTKILAHSGHVTGIAALNEAHLVTCSVDQRVTVWSINPGLEKSFQMVAQKFSHVPDPHDVLVLNGQLVGEFFVVVVGVGLQVFKFAL